MPPRRSRSRREERRKESRAERRASTATDALPCHDCMKPVTLHQQRPGAVRCSPCRDGRRPPDIELTHTQLGPRPTTEEYQQQRVAAEAARTLALAHDPAAKIPKPSAEHRAWVESLTPMIQAAIAANAWATVTEKLLRTKKSAIVTPAFLRVTLRHAKIDEVRAQAARARREGRYFDAASFDLTEKNIVVEGEPLTDRGDGGAVGVPVRGHRKRGAGYPPVVARVERDDLMSRLNATDATLLEVANAGLSGRQAAELAGLSPSTAHRRLGKVTDAATKLADSSKGELAQMFRVARHAGG